MEWQGSRQHRRLPCHLFCDYDGARHDGVIWMEEDTYVSGDFFLPGAD